MDNLPLLNDLPMDELLSIDPTCMVRRGENRWPIVRDCVSGLCAGYTLVNDDSGRLYKSVASITFAHGGNLPSYRKAVRIVFRQRPQGALNLFLTEQDYIEGLSDYTGLDVGADPGV